MFTIKIIHVDAYSSGFLLRYDFLQLYHTLGCHFVKFKGKLLEEAVEGLGLFKFLFFHIKLYDPP